MRNRLPLALSLIALVASLLALAQRGSAGSQLPPHSVGTLQLRNGAVTAAKVRRHSLLASDFRRGQLPQGPQGPPGPPGPSDAYTTAVAGPLAVPVGDAQRTLTELEIPQPGSYAIVASADLESAGSGIATLTCSLDTFAGDADQIELLAGNPTAAAFTVAHTYPAAGSVGLRCAGRAPATVRAVRIVAIRVGTLTDTGLRH